MTSAREPEGGGGDIDIVSSTDTTTRHSQAVNRGSSPSVLIVRQGCGEGYGSTAALNKDTAPDLSASNRTVSMSTSAASKRDYQQTQPMLRSTAESPLQLSPDGSNTNVTRTSKGGVVVVSDLVSIAAEAAGFDEKDDDDGADQTGNVSLAFYSQISELQQDDGDSSRMDNARGARIDNSQMPGVTNGRLPPIVSRPTLVPISSASVQSGADAGGSGNRREQLSTQSSKLNVEQLARGDIEQARRSDDMPPRGARLTRQGALSDLWQQQGAFRSNQRSMKSMFEEFAASLESPENEGKCKAEIKNIFTFTSVGYKHLVSASPSEDRIALHQNVVPTIDDETKQELDIDRIDTTPFAMFGVFDGHGGPACAEFLKNSVSTVLAHSPVLYDEDLAPFERRACATADSFTELEKVHNEWALNSGDLSGSTAILSTFQDGILVMAGVGDSAGLYVDHEGNRNILCPQHSTSNAREVERILNMGGTIVNGRVAGCLMPTRTIGDLDCKQALGDIVSPHPEIKLAAIYAPPEDGIEHDEPFMVLASDGLWDVISNSEVSHIVSRGLRVLRVKTAKEAAKQKKATNNSHNSSSNNTDGAGTNGSGSRFGLGKKKRMSKGQRGDSSSQGSKNTSGGDSGNTSEAGSTGGRGHGGLIDRFFEASGKSMGNLGDGSFLDLSRSTRGLDASVRGDNGGGGHVASAELDASLYAGLRASAVGAVQPITEADESNLEANVPQKQGIAMTGTSATAGARTSGSPADNPAMHLVQAAIRASSRDDISVVVVSFKAAKDKARPGSKGEERKGSFGNSGPSVKTSAA